jgi:hypothetical protein
VIELAAVYEFFLFFFFPACLPTFVGGGVLDGSNSKKSEIEFWYGFDLHFLYGQSWRAFFHVFSSHFDFIFEKFCLVQLLISLLDH